jgi:carbamoyltransferase
VRGEPIVCTIEDAYRCFMGTNLDLLVCENFVLFKEKQPKNLLKEYKNELEDD